MKNIIKFIGIILVIDGVWTLLGGKILIRSEGWVDTSIKFSILSIITGILLIFLSKKYFRHKKTEYSICPKCKETYTYNDLKDGMCPKCDVKTTDLEEYYKKK